jgi:hypothetical protein
MSCLVALFPHVGPAAHFAAFQHIKLAHQQSAPLFPSSN